VCRAAAAPLVPASAATLLFCCAAQHFAACGITPGNFALRAATKRAAAAPARMAAAAMVARFGFFALFGTFAERSFGGLQ